MSQVQRTLTKTGLRRLSPIGPIRGTIEQIGAMVLRAIDQMGSASLLLMEMIRWIWRSATRPKVRLGRPAIVSQLVRVGARSVFIVCLVSGCVGLIRVLQMAPPLDQFGRKDLAANILGVAILRELGPL